MECCHGAAGQKVNHWPENLRWDRREVNLGQDKLASGTTTRGTRNAQSKLRADQVIEIRARAKSR
jgi:hypothetical protein